VPCRNIVDVSSFDILDCDRRRRAADRFKIGLGTNRRDRIAIHAASAATLGQRQQVATNATAQIGQGLAVREAGRFVACDPGVGCLLKAKPREKHPPGARELLRSPPT